MKLKSVKKIKLHYNVSEFLIQVWSYKLYSVNNYVQLEDNYEHTKYFLFEIIAMILQYYRINYIKLVSSNIII